MWFSILVFMFGETPLHIVTDAKQLNSVCQHLSNNQIGVDLEVTSYYRERISLIQVSDSVSDYIRPNPHRGYNATANTFE